MCAARMIRMQFARRSVPNMRKFSKPSRFQKRFYNEDLLCVFQRSFHFFDTNQDGHLQYEEFKDMISTANISEARQERLLSIYFPTTFELVESNIFNALLLETFDENDDGLVQLEEARKMMQFLRVATEKQEILEREFYPLGNESLSAEQFDELRRRLNEIQHDL